MASKDITPTSLENISDNLDVASAIAAWIQSWSQSAGFQDERNRGRILRDSTLRAISLSNKKMRENWHPFLLQQVTITTPTLVSFYRLLERNPKSGELVRSLHFSDQVSNLSEQTMRKCTMEIFPFAKKELRGRPKTQEVMEDAVHNIMNTIFSRVPNLQNLLVEDPSGLMFDFQKGSMPLPFLMNLKSINVPLPGRASSHCAFSARNGIWILSFCPNLRKAALGITVRWDLDYPYMEEFSEAYDGLSKVEDLSIRFSFIQDEKIRRSLWHKGEKPEDWKGFLGGSRKIKAIGLFLKVTNQLNTLEFYAGEKLSAMTQSLTSLTRSFNSLKHLRLLGPGVVTNTPYPIDLVFFKNLRIFSLDLGILHDFEKGSKLSLPDSLETLYLVYYGLDNNYKIDGCALGEETILLKLIKSRNFPNLKEVAVPQAAVGELNNPPRDHSDRKAWNDRRKKLETDEIFKRGNLRLRKLKDGDVVGDPSKGEVCFSCVLWLNP